MNVKLTNVNLADLYGITITLEFYVASPYIRGGHREETREPQDIMKNMLDSRVQKGTLVR